MATLKACVQKMRNDGFFPVYIRVTHNRTTQYIKTDKMVTKRELLETPREFAPRGQATMTPVGKLAWCFQKSSERNQKRRIIISSRRTCRSLSTTHLPTSKRLLLKLENGISQKATIAL